MLVAAATKEEEEDEEEQVSVWRRGAVLYVIIGICHCREVLRRTPEYLCKKTPIKYIMIYLLEENKKKQKQICMVQSNVYDRPPFGKSPLPRGGWRHFRDLED